MEHKHRHNRKISLEGDQLSSNNEAYGNEMTFSEMKLYKCDRFQEESILDVQTLQPKDTFNTIIFQREARFVDLHLIRLLTFDYLISRVIDSRWRNSGAPAARRAAKRSPIPIETRQLLFSW